MPTQRSCFSCKYWRVTFNLSKKDGKKFVSLKKKSPKLTQSPSLCILLQLAKLEQERDTLKKQLHELADCNYAREPEFVQARLKLRESLDEVNAWRRRVIGRHLNPILEKLNKAESKLAEEARSFEEQSEQLAQEFMRNSKNVDSFTEEYIKLRKEASKKRLLADRLVKEKNMLAEAIPRQIMDPNSPIPAPRQKKRVSFNR